MTQKRRIRLVNILPIYRMYDNQITFTKTELSSCLPLFTHEDIGVDFIIKEYKILANCYNQCTSL